MFFVYCFPQFFPKHGFTLLWFHNFTGLQGNYSFGLCHWCKSHCSSQTPVGPAAVVCVGIRGFPGVTGSSPDRFGQKICRSKRLNFIRLGGCYVVGGFYFPACVLFFKFSPTWEDDHLIFFKLYRCMLKTLIWCYVAIAFFFCAFYKSIILSIHRQFNRQNVY